MTIIDKAVPNIVGVDIGCGMYTVNLGNVESTWSVWTPQHTLFPLG